MAQSEARSREEVQSAVGRAEEAERARREADARAASAEEAQAAVDAALRAMGCKEVLWNSLLYKGACNTQVAAIMQDAQPPVRKHGTAEARSSESTH